MKYSSGATKRDGNRHGRKAYESPAIIYKGKISTRAGSPLGVNPLNSSTVADPADLFGDND